MKKILFEDALIYNSALFFGFFIRNLPESAALWIARRIGDAVFFLSPRRWVAIKNLRAAYSQTLTPEAIETIARRSFQNMAMSGIELFRFPVMDEAWLRKNVVVKGSEKFEAAIRQGQGAIFLTGHFGNWELLSMAGSLFGSSVAILVRPQKHPRSDEYLNTLRSCKGAEVIRKRSAVREVIRALRASKLLGILSDQDGGRNGAKVRFFGRLSSTPRGAATFGLRTRVPIFPTFNFRQADGTHCIEIEDALPIPEKIDRIEEAERELLQRFTEILESKIRKDPAQWLWAHRRWKSAPERRVLILNDGKSGHLNQSYALLNAIVDERLAVYPEDPAGFVSHAVVLVEYRDLIGKSLLRAAVLIFGKVAPFRRALLRRALTQRCYRALMAQAPDVVISCGARNAPLNLLISRENSARSAVVLKPLESSANFRAVIVPGHDKMKPSSNVFVTETALTAIDRAQIREESQRLESEIPALKGGGRRRIGILVGGDAEKIRFDRVRFEKVLREILRYRSDTDAVLMATTSRRTPAWADELLKKDLGDRRKCPLLVIANEANRPGVVAGILGLSDALIVSGESISMVSEAVLSGKPVTVFIPSGDKPLKPRHLEFLEGLQRRHLIAICEPEFLYDSLKKNSAVVNPALTRVLENDRQTLRAAAARLLS